MFYSEAMYITEVCPDEPFGLSLIDRVDLIIDHALDTFLNFWCWVFLGVVNPFTDME
jgi:hypothetical protein